MSTDLYGVRILEKDSENKRLKVRIFVVYYDVSYQSHEPIPYDKTFFLSIIRDTNYNEAAFIDKIIDMDDYLNEDWMKKNAYKFIEKVEQISTKNYPVEDWEKLSDFYYEDDGKWEDEDLLVQADYNIYVYDELYINHLEVGDSWGTTSYEMKGINANSNYKNIIPNFSMPYKKLNPFSLGNQEDSTTQMCRFSPNGKYLFAISQANEIVAYETEQWTILWRKKLDGLFAYIYTKDDSTLVAIHNQKYIYLDIKTGNVLSEKEEDTKTSPTQKYTINFRDGSGKSELKNNIGETILSFEAEEEEEIYIAEFSTNEKYLAIGNSDKLQVWDIENKKLLHEINDKIIFPESVSFDASSTFLVYSNLCILNIHTGETILEYSKDYHDLPLLNNGIYSPDNKYFAMDYILTRNGYDSCIHIYNLTNNNQSKEDIKLAKIKAELAANNVSDF